MFLTLTLSRPTGYLFRVAAGVPPAVESGILPGGLSCGLHGHFRVQSCQSGRQDAVLYGSQDGCRYAPKPTLNTCPTGEGTARPVSRSFQSGWMRRPTEDDSPSPI